MIRTLVSAALLAAQAPIARVPDTPCATREEVGAAVITVLPLVLDTMIARCRPHLPDSAFLIRDGGAMAARMQEAAAPRRAQALRALGTGTRINGVVMRSGEEALTAITRLISEGFTRTDARSCADINDLFEALAPLPPENIGRIVGAMAGLAMSRAPVGQRIICAT